MPMTEECLRIEEMDDVRKVTGWKGCFADAVFVVLVVVVVVVVGGEQWTITQIKLVIVVGWLAPFAYGLFRAEQSSFIKLDV